MSEPLDWIDRLMMQFAGVVVVEAMQSSVVSSVFCTFSHIISSDAIEILDQLKKLPGVRVSCHSGVRVHIQLPITHDACIVGTALTQQLEAIGYKVEFRNYRNPGRCNAIAPQP